MSECSRCSECVGEEHHWLEPVDFAPVGSDPDDEEDIVVLHQCKHCPAVKLWDDTSDTVVEDSEMKPREAGCRCDREEGDSTCPVHGEEFDG